MVLSRAQCRRISGFNFDFVIAFVLGLPQHGAGLTQRELDGRLFSWSRMGRCRPVPSVLLISTLHSEVDAAVSRDD